MSSIDVELDFGLAPGERFEPDPLPDDVSIGHPHIRTLLGPVDPDALGMTVFVPRLAGIDGLPNLDAMAALGELESAHAIGLRSIVVTPAGEAMDDPTQLGWIAARSPVHLVIINEMDRVERSISWGIEGLVTTYTIVERPDDVRDMPGDRLLLGIRPEAARTLTDALQTAPLAFMESGCTVGAIRAMLVGNPGAALTRTGGAE